MVQTKVEIKMCRILQGIQDYNSAKTAVEIGADEPIPGDVVHAILDGENAIRVWRDARPVTAGRNRANYRDQCALSLSTGVCPIGKRKGALETLILLAKALNIPLGLITGPTK